MSSFAQIACSSLTSDSFASADGGFGLLAFFAGGWEIWVILVIALLLFGNRIPALARSLGSGIVEFRKGLKGEESPEKKELSGDESSKEIPGGDDESKSS